MSYAVVTVEIDSKTRVDLALPLEVPNHALANAIAQALEVDKSGKEQYSLAVKTEQGVVRLSPQSTLGDASVLDGFYLLLYHEKNAPSPPSKKRPYLQAESGQTFLLEPDLVWIGRKDVKRGLLVDIDLTALDERRIVTRKHATIERQKDKWVLTDQGSVNGTWLNGFKLTVKESYPLQDEDEIIFGRNGVKVVFRLR